MATRQLSGDTTVNDLGHISNLALARLGQSVERVKIWGGSRNLDIFCPCQVLGGRPFFGPAKFFVGRPKFTKFLSSNVEGVVVDQVFFRRLICTSVPKIFEIKIESCQKSLRNLDFFWPSQILGDRPSKNCTQIITLPRGTSSGEVSWRYPHQPEVIEAHTLNFRPDF